MLGSRRHLRANFALLLLTASLTVSNASENGSTEFFVKEAELADLIKAPEASKIPSDAESSGEIEQLRARLDALEATANRYQTDQGKRDAERKKATAEAKSNAQEKWTVKLGGHVQMDYITWADADTAIVDAENYFSYRRLRLVADGTGYGQFDFRLQMTLEPGQGSTDNIYASADVKDAYLSMNDIPGLGRFRVGNFFVPFSLEQVTNDTNNIFTERSVPTEGVFAASREVGAALYNCTEDQDLTWTGGLFFYNINDTDKTRFDDNQDYRLSGRLTWLPYYDEASDGAYLLHTGVGVLHSESNDNVVRFRTRPQIQRGPILIDSGNLPADSFTTGNLELALVWGQFTLQSEAFLSGIAMNNGDVAQATGGYAHMSYFLTGEHRIFDRFGQHGPQFGPNKPLSNFSALPGGVGPGAWEAKVRWSNLDLTDVNQGEYNDFTAGFNWYWSDRTRWMFDWIHPVTTANTPFGETESDLFAMRFDFNW